MFRDDYNDLTFWLKMAHKRAAEKNDDTVTVMFTFIDGEESPDGNKRVGVAVLGDYKEAIELMESVHDSMCERYNMALTVKTIKRSLDNYGGKWGDN